MALTHVIAYDISDDRRRARVAAVLQAYGDRIQRSAFVATVEDETLREARDRISQIINPDTDSLYVSASVRHAGRQSASTARQRWPTRPGTGPCCRE